MAPFIRSCWVWLLLSIVVVFVVCVWARESHILEPVLPAQQLHWQDHKWASGDVLLFSGMGWLGRVGEAVLKVCGRSSFTHVGLVYIDPRTEPPAVYVWEMGSPTVGTKLTPLERVMTRYRGRLVVRPLQGPGAQRGVDSRQLRASIRRRWGLEYGYDFWFYSYNRVFASLPMPSWSSGRERPTRFCSDLVCETLAELGVLDYQHDPEKLHETIPRDFAQATERLPLVPGWSYGQEILLLGTRCVPGERRTLVGVGAGANELETAAAGNGLTPSAGSAPDPGRPGDGAASAAAPQEQAEVADTTDPIVGAGTDQRQHSSESRDG